MNPQLADDTVAEPVDPAAFLFGFRYASGAFTPGNDDGPYDDPDAPSATPGSRLPLLPQAVDSQGYDLQFLTAAPQWAQTRRPSPDDSASRWPSA